MARLDGKIEDRKMGHASAKCSGGTSTAVAASDLAAARRRIAAAYDADFLQGAGHRLVDQLAGHLRLVQEGQGDVLPWRDPPSNVQEAIAMLDRHLPAGADREQLLEQFSSLVTTMLQRGHNLHHPRYLGHQVPASVPLAALFDAVGSATNQVMAIYDMGPWSTAAEYAMIDRLGREIGWPAGQFAGLATHGGSLANLTALLTARNVSLPDCWEQGMAPDAAAPALVVHADAHYSVGRAAGVLGIGTSHVIRAPLDARRRIDANQLDRVLHDMRRQRRPVVAVVACSCSTPIGAFDPLDDIADVCQRYDTWLHVDAAHGASACLSDRHRHRVNGLHRADSLIWDAHKMLFVPALCAFVFLRNRDHQFEAFRQQAPYLFDPAAPGLAEYDSGLRTMECTKRAAAFGLWGLWALFGRGLFADLVDVTYDLGRQLYAKLRAAQDFTTLHEPECNIVAFRHTPDRLKDADGATLGQFQLELRRRVIESGEFYIVSTKIDGVGALRTTLINPLTTPDDLDQLLDSLRRHGRQLLDSR